MTRAGRTMPWVVLVVTVLVGALGQGLMAAPGLGRMPFAAFIAVAVVSAVLLVAQLVVTTWATRMLVTPGAEVRWRPLVVWAAILVAVGALVSALFSPAGLVVAIVAVFALPAAAGRGVSGFAVVRHHPWRSLALALGVIVLGVVSLVVSIATGLFLTGTVGGIVAWLWFGIVIAVLLAWGTHLHARASRPVVGPPV